MFAWWDSLSLISQIFACIAIPTTLVLIIQTILMFIGLDGDGIGDMDGDFSLDHDISDIGIHPDMSDGIFGDDLPVSDPDPSGLGDLHILSVEYYLPQHPLWQLLLSSTTVRVLRPSTRLSVMSQEKGR